MKYAHREAERRFLLASIPAAALTGPAADLHDRYLRDTRLRLRRVVRPGEPPVLKLGQKIPSPDGWPPAVAHTSLYLDPAEYALLAALPADELTKTRTVLTPSRDGPALAVDVFTGRLAGLVLAEYELDPADRPTPGDPSGATPPGWPELSVLAEVTDDVRFSGGALARTSAADLANSSPPTCPETHCAATTCTTRRAVRKFGPHNAETGREARRGRSRGSDGASARPRPAPCPAARRSPGRAPC
jgi:CYTH domain-containing protein